MPRCVDCDMLNRKLNNWCMAWKAHVKAISVDLPCSDFKPKKVSSKPIEIITREQGRFKLLERERKPVGLSEERFIPRWISRYIVESIMIAGDMSLAYDLLDADRRWRRRYAR